MHNTVNNIVTNLSKGARIKFGLFSQSIHNVVGHTDKHIITSNKRQLVLRVIHPSKNFHGTVPLKILPLYVNFPKL